MSLPYYHVDAFVGGPFRGNQAAVMLLPEWVPDDVLQGYAAEHNFAETAFVVDSGRGTQELRWFTPACEVRLCGHATLAAGHVLLTEDEQLERVALDTRKVGRLEVVRADDGYEVGLPAISVVPHEGDELGPLFGRDPSALFRNAEGYTVLLYDSQSDITALSPDFRTLAAQYGEEQFICTAPGEDSVVVSRVFVPGAGVDEDSVTGSAHAVLTPFWADRLGRANFSAHQASERGGWLHCRLDGDRAWLAGKCRTIVEGRYIGGPD